MDLVHKVMAFLGFERDFSLEAESNHSKIIYKKSGVAGISDRNHQNIAFQGQVAAREHIQLQLFDRAILWIFENIVSRFMEPPASVTHSQNNRNDPPAMVDVSQVTDQAADKAKNVEKLFGDTKKMVGSFLGKNQWPNGGNIFDDDVRSLADTYWKTYKNLVDKSAANEEDRLNYAAAAYVLGEDRPSFEPGKKALASPSPPARDGSVIEASHTIVDDVVSQVSKGENLFQKFVRLYADKDFGDLDSLGSPFFQPESLGFARKIIDEDNRIKKTFPTPPSNSEVAAAIYLRTRKTALEGKAEENSRRQAERAKNEQIAKEKEQLRPGEWEFNQFVDRFVEFRDKDLRFILLKEKGYLADKKLLAFAATVKGDASTTSDQQQAAEYLSKWSRNPDAAAEAAQKKNGFSWPPEPPAPPPRRVAVPKVEPPPLSPDRQAVESLLSADVRQRHQLLGLMGLDAGVFYSGLEVLATIWLGQPSLVSEKSLSGLSSGSLDDLPLSYTDLEKADNAIRVMNAIANLNTGHDIDLSSTVKMLKDHRDLVAERLVQYRRQIIYQRQIFPIENMTGDQISRGQQIFEEFRRSFEAALSRGEPDKLIMRDTYFLDECVSYASHLQATYSNAKLLTDADQQSLVAIAYLMSKYSLFKSPAST